MSEVTRKRIRVGRAGDELRFDKWWSSHPLAKRYGLEARAELLTAKKVCPISQHVSFPLDERPQQFLMANVVKHAADAFVEVLVSRPLVVAKIRADEHLCLNGNRELQLVQVCNPNREWQCIVLYHPKNVEWWTDEIVSEIVAGEVINRIATAILDPQGTLARQITGISPDIANKMFREQTLKGRANMLGMTQKGFSKALKRNDHDYIS